jgi:hypothetical protein
MSNYDGIDCSLPGEEGYVPVQLPMFTPPVRPAMEKRCPTCPFNADKKPFRQYLADLCNQFPPWARGALIQDEVDAALMVLTVMPEFVCHYDLLEEAKSATETLEGLQGMRSCAGAKLAVTGEAEDTPAVKRARRLLAAKRGPLRAERRERLTRLFNLAFQTVTELTSRAIPESSAGQLMARYKAWLESE